MTKRRSFNVEVYPRDSGVKEGGSNHVVRSYTPFDAAQDVLTKLVDPGLRLLPGEKHGPAHWWFIGEDRAGQQVIVFVHELVR